MKARPSFEKRRKEMARQEKKKDKAERRKDRLVERQSRPDAVGDPDIDHIVWGPQPKEEDEDYPSDEPTSEASSEEK